MMRRWRFAAVLIAALGVWASPAAARSVALVIGNADYRAAPLRNPLNDAARMGAVLEGALQFDSVTVLENLGPVEMRRALGVFAAEARGADTAVLFYAGHGMEVDGVNYLIPAGEGLSHPSAARYEAVTLADAIAAVSGATRLAAVILDACRDNPWGGTRGSRGLSRVETSAPGLVVAYSTAPGELAQDGAGALSPYTQALTEALEEAPSLDVRLLFTSLADRTAALAGAPQEPWASFGRFPRDATALGRIAAAPAAAPPPTPAAAPPEPEGFWARLTALPQGAALKECDVCPEMVAIPDGSFTMGEGEGAIENVTIQPFALGRDAVTVSEYRRFVTATGHEGKRCFTFESRDGPESAWVDGADWASPNIDQGEDHPVVCVNHEDAEAYVAWLNGQAGVEGAPYRLPSEAEQEYVLRADHGATPYPWGDDPTAFCSAANGADQSAKLRYPDWTSVSACDDGYAHTAPVSAFSPNGFGVRQLSGNVWEWSADCWNASLDPALSNGSARLSGDCSRAVLRGGSWNDHPWDLRSARRSGGRRGIRNGIIGFRLARTAGD